MYIYFLVLGQIKPEELGKTLTHEHVSMTFEFTYKKPKVIYKGVLTTVRVRDTKDSYLVSMTQLLTHSVAHSTNPSSRPKTNNQPLKKFLSLVFS